MGSLLSHKRLGEILLVLGVLSFSFEWYFVRGIGALGFTSLDAVFGRLFYACLFFAAALWVSGYIRKSNKIALTTIRASLTSRAKILIALMGLDAVATNFLFNYAVQRTSVANALVLFYSSVFWGSLLGALIFKEQLSRRSLGYTLLAFLGIVLALADFSKLSIQFGAGEICALLASVTFSFEIVMARGLKSADFLKRMAGMYLAGSLCSVLIIAGANGLSHVWSLFTNVSFLILALAFALSCGVVGKGLSYLGVNRVSVNKALVILLLEPIAQMASAYFVAHETISLLNSFGILVVFLAVAMISRGSPQATETELEGK